LALVIDNLRPGLTGVLVLVLGSLPALVTGCSLGGRSGSGAGRAATFDLAAARDTRTLGVTETTIQPPHEGVTAVSLRFRSFDWQSGKPSPIWLHGYLARPTDVGAVTRRPGVVVAHGLGAKAELQVAVDLARTHAVTVLALSAPGLGESQGRAVTFDDARALYDADGDARKSWLYAYAFGVMRAVTVLAARGDVDPEGIVLAGTSMGAVASLMVNATDDRIKGVLAASVSGGWPEAAGGGSWLGRLFTAASGLPPGDRKMLGYFSAFDPMAFADRQHGAVYLFSGAQDEFFPLPQLLATWRRLRAPDKHLAILPDWDHQWYFASGCPARCMPGGKEPRAEGCSAQCPVTCPVGSRWPYCGAQASYNRHEDAIARWGLLLRALVSQHARHPRGPEAPPPPPVVVRRGDEIQVRVTGAPPRAVRLAVSDNGGFTYGQVRLSADKDGVFRYHHPGLSRAAVIIAEVENLAGAIASSVPELSADFRPVLRPFGQR
jgi:dienelactone hydrolase